jgi:hypothetical protein
MERGCTAQAWKVSEDLKHIVWYPHQLVHSDYYSFIKINNIGQHLDNLLNRIDLVIMDFIISQAIVNQLRNEQRFPFEDCDKLEGIQDKLIKELDHFHEVIKADEWMVNPLIILKNLTKKISMVVSEIHELVAGNVFMALIDQIRNQIINIRQEDNETFLYGGDLINRQLNLDFWISGPRNFVKSYKDEIERLNWVNAELVKELEEWKGYISNLETQIETNYDSPMLKPLEDYLAWFSNEMK